MAYYDSEFQQHFRMFQNLLKHSSKCYWIIAVRFEKHVTYRFFDFIQYLRPEIEKQVSQYKIILRNKYNDNILNITIARIEMKNYGPSLQTGFTSRVDE